MRVLKTMRKKLKSNRGFTLVEMMVSLAIVVMLSIMMSVGVSVGASVQRESTFVAESDMLASTLNTALGDVLRYAKEPTPVNPLADGDEAENDKERQGVKTRLQNEDGSKKYLIDTDYYGISDGAIFLDKYENDSTQLRVAVSQYVVKDEMGNTGEKVYCLVSHGLYTNLIILDNDEHPFSLTYDETEKCFHINYWIAEKNNASPLVKEVDAYFRMANK